MPRKNNDSEQVLNPMVSLGSLYREIGSGTVVHFKKLPNGMLKVFIKKRCLSHD
jgi:hypothetical protein